MEYIKQFLENHGFTLFIIGVVLGALVAHSHHIN